jgi:REP element-mobilizing transposase RayT
VQAGLLFDGSGWGGRRRGAGRKARGERPLHPHVRRPEQSGRHPLHLTTKLRAGLPNLRRASSHRLLLRTLSAGADRFGFRLIEFSVQSNHFHLLVEVSDRTALTRGAKGILVRLAKQLNKHWGRNGQVFADRFHARALRSPREVRRALAYVLHNARRHGSFGRGIDPYSSGPWFDGFTAESLARALRVAFVRALHTRPRPTCRARCWLLIHGWRHAGPIHVDEQSAHWQEPG